MSTVRQRKPEKAPVADKNVANGVHKRRPRTSKVKVVLYSLVAVTLIVTVIVPLVGAYFVLNASRYRPYDRLPHNIGLPEPKVVILSSPGFVPGTLVNITGWWLPQGGHATPTQWNEQILRHYNETNTNATIIVVHGHGSNMGRVMGIDDGVLHKAMLIFHTAGYNVFSIDLRNHGTSAQSLPITFGRHECDDVLAAADWLVQNAAALGIDAGRIGLWGESMGGATSLLAAEKDRHVRRFKAVVSDSSYTNATKAIAWRGEMQYKVPKVFISLFWKFWDLLSPWNVLEADAVRAVGNIEVPVMIIHGSGDRVVAFEDGVDLHEAALRAQKEHGRPPRVEKFWHEGGHVKAFRVEGHYDTLIKFYQDHV